MFNFKSLALCFLAVGQSAAHFFLNYPPSIGFVDNLEGTPPCGSFTPDLSKANITNFGVGGSGVALTSIHPQATWLFRATLDTTASGNWTSLMPAVQQTGLGDFCEPVVPIPASWAGQTGILGVVQDAPDGILYQCAVVKFVAGTLSPPSDCTNVTGLSAIYTTDASLSSLPASATSSSSSTSSTATTSSGSTATTKASAANKGHTYDGTGLLAWVGMATCAVMGAFLL